MATLPFNLCSNHSINVFCNHVIKDRIHRRWDGTNSEFGIFDGGLIQFIQHVQQHDRTFNLRELNEDLDEMNFMKVFKLFTRGQSKLDYLRKLNKTGLDLHQVTVGNTTISYTVVVYLYNIRTGQNTFFPLLDGPEHIFSLLDGP